MTHRLSKFRQGGLPVVGQLRGGLRGAVEALPEAPRQLRHDRREQERIRRRREVEYFEHSCFIVLQMAFFPFRSLPKDSAAEGKTLKGYELSGWIKVSAEPAEGEKTEAEGDFVFLYDFRNTKS